ncbi:MAG: 16S rRNA (uracil(1498)-N(3))-methyltransferase [Gammaproteobacteria bacterium]
MRTVRVYSETKLDEETTVSLDDQAARHIARVLRMRSGDAIVLFDGSGLEFPGILINVTLKSVSVELEKHAAPNTESPLQIKLWHGICRGEKMDYVIQKATELGVYEIQPVLTHRSVVKLDADRASKRVEHWRRVAISAAEQSGRVFVPEILAPQTLLNALEEETESTWKFLLDPQAEKANEKILQGDTITLLTGPEGGFTEEERQAGSQAGFTLMALGPRVLRSETAPVSALSILQHQFGDMGKRP